MREIAGERILNVAFTGSLKVVVVDVWSHVRILVPEPRWKTAMHHTIIIMMTLYTASRKREQANAFESLLVQENVDGRSFQDSESQAHFRLTQSQ